MVAEVLVDPLEGREELEVDASPPGVELPSTAQVGFGRVGILELEVQEQPELALDVRQSLVGEIGLACERLELRPEGAVVAALSGIVDARQHVGAARFVVFVATGVAGRRLCRRRALGLERVQLASGLV